MGRHKFLFLLFVIALVSPNCLSQSLAVATKTNSISGTQPATVQPGDLALLNTVKTSYVNTGMVLFPFKCDRDGNVYLRTLVDDVPEIHEFNGNGKELAVFEPDSASPELDVRASAGYFSVASSAYLYQLTSPWNVRSPHVFVYRLDGTLKSYIKLQTGFPWIPAQVAAFPAGNFLVTGGRYDRDREAAKWPFTGVFSSEGKLLKEVKLEDDDAIHEMAALRDVRVVPPEAPSVNHAIGLAQLDAADDGNVYLMRRLSPAILYAISPSGEVLRRFTVDGGLDYMPESMHIAGNRIAVEFSHQLIKIVDLEGRELATYGADPASPLGWIACYSASPERLTFVGGGAENERLTFQTAAPR